MIEKIKRNHPAVVICRPDFIFDTTYIEKIDINTVFQLDTSTAALDTILIRVPDSIAVVIRKIYKDKKLINDTLSFTQDSVLVKLYQLPNGQLAISVFKPKASIAKVIPTECPELNCELTWWQKFRLEVFWILVIIGIVLIGMRRLGW